ncbi:hypothetical protein PQI66_08860 [Corynebacterium sp. USCH3]|uniref:hypothetical protein n=1 Tax=Corynebacterium sp. USCH3 TaxID=3024840 RepID=UPI00309F96DD
MLLVVVEVVALVVLEVVDIALIVVESGVSSAPHAVRARGMASSAARTTRRMVIVDLFS